VAGNRIYEDEIFFERISLHLVVTALAKLYGLTYGEQVLQQPDPLFGVKNSVVMLLVSVAELWVVYLVLSATQSVTKLAALAWISSNFLAYRFGLYMVGFKGWCSCLGTLTKQLPVSPERRPRAVQQRQRRKPHLAQRHQHLDRPQQRPLRP
jgi:hypothetical protein